MASFPLTWQSGAGAWGSNGTITTNTRTPKRTTRKMEVHGLFSQAGTFQILRVLHDGTTTEVASPASAVTANVPIIHYFDAAFSFQAQYINNNSTSGTGARVESLETEVP